MMGMRIQYLLVAILALGAAARAQAAGSADDLAISRVFGNEHPGPYKHPASISQLANGDLYIAYYGGEGEYATETSVYGSRQKKGEQTWSAPQPIATAPFASVGNAVVWQAPDGVVWLFYVYRPGETWSSSRIMMKVSRDGAQTWLDAQPLTFEEGTMVQGRPEVMMNGEYWLPVYHETGADIEMTGASSESFFLRHDPKSRKWSETGRIRHKKGNIQPGIFQIDEKYLIAYCRRGGNYEPTTDGWMVRSESRDGGKTWSEGADSKFKNPNAAISLLKLANGHLLMVYNDSMNERTPLTASVSTDNDKTWPHKRDIATGPYDYAYPYAIQLADKKICLIYTSHERAQINLAIFAEEAILKAPGK